MHCCSCHKKIDDKNYEFCPYCGESLCKSKFNSQSINVKNSSMNIGGVGNNHNYHIDNIHYNVSDYNKNIDYEIDKVTKIPLNIKKTSITAGFVTFLGLLGSVASIIGVFKGWDFFDKNEWIMPILMFIIIFSTGLIYLLRILKKQGFKGISTFIGNFFFWIDEVGNLYLIKTYSDCPKCNGVIKVKKMKDKEKYIGICNTNSEHIYSFDFTAFKGKEMTIEEIQVKVS